ncbi:MAG: universal stress protein [Thermodesulfovibrionia bacterium]|nr:universal stress protein [Thermodesulfovibrionia bacterium]
MFKNIIVGFDDSEYSKAALVEVSNWVRRHGGKITLVHAVYFDEEEFATIPEQLEKRFEVGKKVCYQAKERFSAEFGVEIDSLICEGEAPKVILDVARDKGADLIAMGTYGRKGIKRLIMGSVTSGVIIDSPCDVLVVKRPCSECTGEYRSILVPFDGSDNSKTALGRAFPLSKIDSASVTVLYVIPRYEEMVEFFRTVSIQKRLLEEAKRITDVAEKIASESSILVKTIVEEGHSGEKIVETARRLKSDLIIMGSHGWRGIDKAIIGSTAESVISNASVPVLVVR